MTRTMTHHGKVTNSMHKSETKTGLVRRVLVLTFLTYLRTMHLRLITRILNFLINRMTRSTITRLIGNLRNITVHLNHIRSILRINLFRITTTYTSLLLGNINIRRTLNNITIGTPLSTTNILHRLNHRNISALLYLVSRNTSNVIRTIRTTRSAIIRNGNTIARTINSTIRLTSRHPIIGTTLRLHTRMYTHTITTATTRTGTTVTTMTRRTRSRSRQGPLHPRTTRTMTTRARRTRRKPRTINTATFTLADRVTNRRFVFRNLLLSFYQVSLL